MRSGDINEILEEQCGNYIDTCPHCGSKAHLQLIHNDSFIDAAGHQHNYMMFRCVPCKMLCIKEYLSKQNQYSDEQDLEMKGWLSKYPNLGTKLSQEFTEYVPSSVLEDYQEGAVCMSVCAHKGAVSMFRRTIQDSMIDLGADQKDTLVQQINSVDRLTKDIKDWAHNVRIFGNWGEHPQDDLLNDITGEIAQEVKSFVEEFMNYVYVMPGKVSKSRQKYARKSENAKSKL